MALMQRLFTDADSSRFLTLPQERLIVEKRAHWLVVVMPIFLLAILGIGAFILNGAVFLYYLPNPILFIFVGLLILGTMASIFVKIIADWYYHLYIITTRRIMEVSYAPLFSEHINDVLLDQVRITEVDVQIKSLIQEFFNMGDVVIVFDRPSHEETFVMINIEDPGNIGTVVSNALEALMHDTPIWFHPRQEADVFRLSEDVYTSSALKTS